MGKLGHDGRNWAVEMSGPQLWTIGYGNRTFQPWILALHKYEITHVVDVRAIPESRHWTDFRRAALATSLPDLGLKYLFMGDRLGIVEGFPREIAYMNPADRKFALLPEPFQIAIDRLKEAALEQDRRIALLCGCLRPDRCHRGRVLGPVLEALGVNVLHIDADDQVLTQAELDE